MIEAVAWPLQRRCRLVDASLAPTIDRLWESARLNIARIRERLAVADLPEELETVGLCGSLARMEATSHSDVDLIVVCKRPLSESRRRRLVQVAWDVLSELGYELPRRDGIFSQAIARDELIATATLGAVEEPMAVFGCRMQILLEAQPVWNDAGYADLLNDVLRCRFGLLEEQGRGSGGSYLMNDLVRYYRSMWIACQGQDLDNPARWRLRNIKIRLSRRFQYCGMILSMSRTGVLRHGGMLDDQTRGRLLESMRHSPLERVLADSNDDDLQVRYDQVLRQLDAGDLRDQLTQERPEGRFSAHPAYRRIESQLDEIGHCLAERMRRLDAETLEQILL